MKQRLKNLISSIIVIAMIVVGIVGMSHLTERKDSQNKYASFYNEESNIDVFFLGSSHMLNGVYPMELWKDYGIVSYNMGGHGSRLITSYWMLKNGMDYHTPKLVVLDCYFLSRNGKVSGMELGKSWQHSSFDAIPLSANKIDAIEDVFDEEKDRSEFFWKFSLYHNRWEELTEEDFISDVNLEKGAESRINVAVPRVMEVIDKSSVLKKKTLGEEYLRKIIEECQQNGVEVLLTYLPFPANKRNQREANTIYAIAEEYGVNYINFLDEDVVDFQTDCYDSESHLNPSGARKVTQYIGEYIQKNYDITNHQNDEAYANWHEDYKNYTRMKIENIEKQIYLQPSLMLLQDDKLSYNICIRKGSDVLNNGTNIALLKNIGVDCSQINLETNTTILIDNIHGEVSYYYGDVEIDSVFGAIKIKENKGKLYASWEKKRKCLLRKKKDVGIIVYNNETKRRVTLVGFE